MTTCIVRSIPRPLRDRLERFFSSDFAGVRLVELPREPLPGVQALTSGETIYFSPGRLCTRGAAGIELLAHELAHVRQQRAGAVAASKPGIVREPLLEADAERCAAGAAEYVRGDCAWKPVPAGEGVIEPGRSEVLQPYVMMAINRSMARNAHFPPGSWTLREADYQLLTDVAAATAQVRRLAPFQGANPDEIEASLRVLRRWMGISIGGTVYTRPGEIVRAYSRDAAALARMAIGRQAELKYFNNYGELTTALVGEMRSEPRFIYETALAKAVLRTVWTSIHLRSLADGIVEYWIALQNALYGPAAATTTLGYVRGDAWTFKGSYWQYHWYTTPLSGLKKAASNTIDVNIALIHDMMEFVKAKAGESHLHRTLQWTNPNTGVVIDIEKREMRNNLGTVNEAFPVVREGRRHGYRMQAGPSFTVSQMMALADSAGATQNEKTALAYAIFAFWNQVYQKGCTPIHTYYEVMVAAQNYGVVFNAAQSMGQNAPGNIRAVLQDIWERELDYPMV